MARIGTRRSKGLLRIALLVATAGSILSSAASALTIQYDGIGAVAGGGVSLGDTISISFDYDPASGIVNGSGPGQLAYSGAVSNVSISTTSAIATAAFSPAGISVANVNFFGFEGYYVVFSNGSGEFLAAVLPFDVPGASLDLPTTLPSEDQLDPSRIGSVEGFSRPGIHFQYQDNANQTQFAWFDFTPVSSVPEPGAALLIGIAFLALAGRRRLAA